ncbi:MAG TPA: PDZ domain-containing protein [Gemmatimonadaceae bacterium]|nr:PDZ domain-containing protein [Gemmatimonadaceae bacterium]
MRRPLLTFTVAAAAASGVPSPVSAGPAQTPGAVNRVIVVRDSTNRAESERLLLRLDSLRSVLDNQRLSESENARVRDQIRRTAVALRERLDEVRIPSRAPMAFMPPSVSIVPRYSTAGYLGVSFDGPSIDQSRRGERIIRFLDYPRIALVEPSSPAERAGIHEGDSLLAFNGDDVRQREFSLTKLLVPDQKIVVRVRRDGSPMDFSVTVEKAPPYVLRRRVGPEDWPGRSPEAVPIPLVPVPPTPDARQVEPRQSVWIINEGVGGAKMETINEGLARTIGVKEGVLVLRAMPGSPAYESGLRDGDIVLRAADRSVASVRELREIVERQRGEDVKLVILRERKRMELTLSW